MIGESAEGERVAESKVESVNVGSVLERLSRSLEEWKKTHFNVGQRPLTSVGPGA